MNSIKRSAALLAVALLFFWGCGRQETSANDAKRQARRPLEGRLVYQRGEGEGSEIYVMDLASRRGRRLTANDAADEYPRWSPDGRSIAFYSDRDGTRQIYV
ncbi:MAG: hypothetical protein NT045_05595, partial [Candidatus Aureabacteria bacterium]|nr:hypothetical protein [Candidatus Auribacterota bacterium]